MDAMDQLLMKCHVNSLNLFVEYFLQMVEKLLNGSEPNLQLRATASFEKFANIKVTDIGILRVVSSSSRYPTRGWRNIWKFANIKVKGNLQLRATASFEKFANIKVRDIL